jgi:microsomal epoxide hydrolase
MPVSPFVISIPETTLDDLRERLARARPSELNFDTGWDYGTDVRYLRDLLHYWRDSYDWRAQEAELNRYAHYRATIDGIGVHFVHQRGVGPNPLPIVLTHGWPDSFYRMLPLMPLLVDPGSHGGRAEDAFDVVVPSIPGFGFSDKPTERGLTGERVADLWNQLMRDELGYDRYVAHGGDMGSSVTLELARKNPDVLFGIHLTDVPYLALLPLINSQENLSAEEQEYLKQGEQWGQQEGAYGMVQSTKPQTLAHGLNDSPTGLASWIVEKFRGWSDCAGDIEKRFTKDQLLTNIMIYWVTETIGSSFLMYYEPMHTQPIQAKHERTEVPAGFAMFPHDLLTPPRSWAERFFNVRHWTEMPSGGHFAAMEEPELLAEDIRAFFRPLREQSAATR